MGAGVAAAETAWASSRGLNARALTAAVPAAAAAARLR